MKKPNLVRTVLAVALCKGIRWTLRKTGRGGTAIPGLAAMKVGGDILLRVSEGMQIVVVTGTNGKTTTCNMIRHCLLEAGLDCLVNNAGANMLHGMAADLICNADWRGRPKKRYVVLECDEAALKLIAPSISPKVIVVTNLFSDQVDRYGGIGNTLEEIRAGVEKAPSATLVLNAEDPRTASLGLNVPNQILWFGMDKSVGQQGVTDLSDAGVCPVCGSAYEYDYHVYAHLGGFRCPKCGYARKAADVAVTAILEATEQGSTVEMNIKGEKKSVRLSLPAIYNIYNGAACLGASLAMGIPADQAIASLGTVKSAFGRLETFDLGGKSLQMILVKNPAGANQALSYVTGFQKDFVCVMCLNNRTGDGEDFSWIEEADYERLCTDEHLKKLYACGDQAEALADRLNRAGAAPGLVEVAKDYKKLVAKLREQPLPIFALPNYTAMMELRGELLTVTDNQAFWE